MNHSKRKNLPSMREATPEDYDIIRNLLQSVELPVEGVRENIRNFLLLFEKDRAIGTVGLEIYGKKALLRSLAVIKEYQGKGFGKKLCRSVMEKARKLKISELYLLTEGAEDFFAGQGFSIVSRETVDEKVKSSIEFRILCPQTATCMFLKLA
ncbi:MAG: GNAT family N-acetyltransferase [bacterium]|nr:MAG: GNAT family N-acetyltransferase [bacterium]